LILKHCPTTTATASAFAPVPAFASAPAPAFAPAPAPAPAPVPVPASPPVPVPPERSRNFAALFSKFCFFLSVDQNLLKLTEKSIEMEQTKDLKSSKSNDICRLISYAIFEYIYSTSY
jgi:hypothetical protein